MGADESIGTQDENGLGWALLLWHGTRIKIGPYLSSVRHAPTIVVVCFAALALSFPLSDTDIWWHLSSARAMLESLSWLRSDPFCTSSLGDPWTDLHWGFQILAFAWWRLGGDTALVALRVVLVVAAVWIALRGRMGWGPAIVAILIVFQMRTFLDLRPLLVSLVALAALWRLLEGAPSALRWTGAILLQIALANTQGLFLLGPLFALASGCGALLERRKHVAVPHLASAATLVAASLANPWGWNAFDLATRVAGRIVPSASNLFSKEIPENLPLHQWIPAHPGGAIVLAWIAVFAWISLRPGPGWAARALLLAGTGLLACMAVRNLPLFGLAVLLSVENRPVRIPWMLPVCGILVPGLLAAPLLLERRWDDPSSAAAPLRLPDSTTLSLVEREPGPIFHEIRAGGWLSWNLPGRNTCWCDTRLVLHDAAFVADYLDVLRRPDRFEEWSRERGFRFALLPVHEMPDAHPLVVHLLASGSWKLVDCDGAWALFARPDASVPAVDWKDAEGRSRIASRIRERLGDNSRLERLATRSIEALLREAEGSR